MQKRVLLFSILLFSTLFSFTQNFEECILENTNKYNEFDTICFADAYDNYRLFIMGEYHFKEENTILFLEVFKNLYRNANVRVIFLETGYANSIILNHYMETGDELSLSYATNTYQFERYMYEDLKEFYDSLPDDEKFLFVGVDLEIYEADTKFIYTMELLSGENVIPDSLYTLFYDFESLAGTEEIDKAQESFDKIYFDWKNNKDYYVDIMGDNYADFVRLLKRTKKSYRFQFYNYNYGRDTLKQTQRERFIYNNVAEEVKKHPDDNFYAQFGLAHIGQDRFLIAKEKHKFQSFSAKLNTNKKSPIKNQICSIAILYFEEYEDQGMLYKAFQKFTYFMSRKKYLPNKIYKTIKKNTENGEIYVTNISKNCSSLNKETNKNFQYIIFKR